MYTGNNPCLIDAEAIAAVISDSGWGDAAEVAGKSLATVIIMLAALFVIVSVSNILIRKLKHNAERERG